MGSGRFPGEGYACAAYFSNVQVVDWDNSLVPAAELRIRTAAAAVEIRRRPSLSPSCLHGATVLSLSRWSSSSPAASVRGLDGGPARRRRTYAAAAEARQVPRARAEARWGRRER